MNAAGVVHVPVLPLRLLLGGLGGFGAGGGFQAEFGDRGVPHLELLHLAGDRHRELRGDPQVPGDLEVGDLAGAELAEFLLGQLLAGPELDPSTGTDPNGCGALRNIASSASRWSLLMWPPRGLSDI
jgi:hypothetical protein